MKKFSYILIMIFILLISSCSNFSNIGGEKKDQTVKVTIVDGDFQRVDTLKYGEPNNINYLTKPGYYLKGIYDEPSGGTMYFDSLGIGQSEWQENYPTTLYAQWESVNGLAYESNVTHIEKAYDFEYAVDMYRELPAYFVNACKGNMGKKLFIEVSFRTKADKYSSNECKYTVSITDSNKNDRETFAKKEIIVSQEYNPYIITFTVDARCAINGGIHCILFRGVYGPDCYIKDYSVKVKFIE